MYIQILKGYALGYVRIIIEGFFIERLINLCIKRKILLWNTKRKKASVLEFARFEKGEGIEKKEENFAEEVMKQLK